MARLKTDDPIVRAKIMAAAERLFAERGFAGTSTRDIAATAGVTSAMLHYYFGNKAGLYRAILETAVETVRSFIAEAAESSAPADKRLTRFIEVESTYLLSHRNLVRILMREMLSGGKEIVKIFQKHRVTNYSMLRQVIADGVQRNEFRQIDIDLAPVSLMGMIAIFHLFQPVISAIIGKPEYDEQFIKRMATHTANIFLGGVLKQKAGPKPAQKNLTRAQRKKTPAVKSRRSSVRQRQVKS
jgi:TetR/AcrR family transcriptional regulator